MTWKILIPKFGISFHVHKRLFFKNSACSQYICCSYEGIKISYFFVEVKLRTLSQLVPKYPF